jgi:hypothetical protein
MVDTKSQEYGEYQRIRAEYVHISDVARFHEREKQRLKEKHEEAIFAALTGGQSGADAVKSADHIFGPSIAKADTDMKSALITQEELATNLKAAWKSVLAAPKITNNPQNEEAEERSRQAGALRRIHNWLLGT